ncbi:hypothetical protein [Streptomyces sp. NPDC048192]|uniref:hypothetical protein n=1 Tax=Streptomyces sp. NPDC048192 TaxID=3365510 RepID=UPI0037113E63
MDAGDWIALAAVVVSVGAAAISMHQAKTAKDSASHAKEQADAAREANELTRQQIARHDAKEQEERIEAQAAALREAEAVHLGVGGNAWSLLIRVQNRSSRPISNVQLMDVRADEPGPWRSWTVNPNVTRAMQRTQQKQLDPNAVMTTAVWLLDEHGQHLTHAPGAAKVEVRFRDADGQWWMTELTDGPRRIDAPSD